MKHAVIFDYNGTLYADGLVPGARELLDYLKEREIPMFLIAKGDEDRRTQMEELGIVPYFWNIIIDMKKNPAQYAMACGMNALFGEVTMWVVGDRICEEIAYGNSIKEAASQYGCNVRTVWIQAGKFAHEVPLSPEQRPDEIITALPQFAALIAA